MNVRMSAEQIAEYEAATDDELARIVGEYANTDAALLKNYPHARGLIDAEPWRVASAILNERGKAVKEVKYENGNVEIRYCAI